jgi:hypothetical protein
VTAARTAPLPLGAVRTSAYRLWTPQLGVPVRTTVGQPRVSFPLVEWPRVYPRGLFNADLDESEFRRRYRHRLHRQTGRILQELRELREGYGDLVLLCFEPPGVFCHRRILAGWLGERLGEEVPEVP